MTTQDLAVVIPAHNAAPFLSQTLDALAKQTVPLAQVVVVEDGSTDQTGQIARDFEMPDGSRPYVIRNDAPQGVAAARNRGFVATDAQWVGFCDSDDLWHANRVATILGVARDRPEARAIATGVHGFALESDRPALAEHPRSGMVNQWVADEAIDELVTRAVGTDWSVTEVTLNDLQADIVFATTTVTYRRDAFAAAGGFARWSHLADDYMLNVAIAVEAPIVLHLAPLVNYRVRANSLSHAGLNIALPYLASNVAARFGTPTVDHAPAGHLYEHMLLNRARHAATLRESLGFALLGGGSPRLLARVLRSKLRSLLRR